MRRSSVLAWPYLGGLVLLIGIPAVAASVLAFTEYSGIQPPQFNGLENFTRLVNDPFFWNALRNSLIFVAFFVPLRVGGAAVAALLLHRRSGAAAMGRPIAYLPTVMPDVAYALLWLWVLNPLFGPLAAGIEALGLTSPGWLTNPWATRVAIAVMSAFQIGEGFIVALAARRALPSTIYEAASVDGASPWFTLTRITLPLMAPILGLLAFRDLILSFQLNFVPALIVTEGGPRLATTFLPLYIYRSAFTYFRLGYASAVSFALFLFTAVVVAVQYLLVRRWRPT
ncbi:MAG: sugar ABC transporter permease [Actinomycetota bacterium]|nr:sugar ABC transporter permease [Actinomycetota bacterium]